MTVPGIIAKTTPLAGFSLSSVDYYTDTAVNPYAYVNIGAAQNEPIPIIIAYAFDNFANPSIMEIEEDSGNIRTRTRKLEKFASAGNNVMIHYAWQKPTGADITIKVDQNAYPEYVEAWNLGWFPDFDNVVSASLYVSEADLDISVAERSLTYGWASGTNVATDVGIVGITPVRDPVRPGGGNEWHQQALVQESASGTRTCSADNNGTASGTALGLINIPPQASPAGDVGLVFQGYDTDPSGGIDFSVSLASGTPSASDEFIIVFCKQHFSNSWPDLGTIDGQSPQFLGAAKNNADESCGFWHVTGCTSNPMVIPNNGYYYGACAVYKVTNFNFAKFHIYSTGSGAKDAVLPVWGDEGGKIIACAQFRSNPADFSLNGCDSLDVNEVIAEADEYFSVGTTTGLGAVANHSITVDTGFDSDTHLTILSMGR